jgi:hypothetical protein
MNSKLLIGELRERIGPVTVQEVSDRRLSSYITFAMDWLAGELGFNVKEDNFSLVLSAGVSEYPLARDVLSIIWMEWNSIRLEPVSISQRDRDRENWKTLTASNPLNFAVQGRSVILLPPPSASAVSTDSIVSYRYIASADPVTADGPHGLSENDHWVIVYRAAYEFCVSNPSDVNTARAQGYTSTITELLERSRQRWASPADLLNSSFAVDVGARTGGAR